VVTPGATSSNDIKTHLDLSNDADNDIKTHLELANDVDKDDTTIVVNREDKRNDAGEGNENEHA
jgi:hypothetical protein